jgi:hydroxymethylglutaryl-CoA reductase (NADPH)
LPITNRTRQRIDAIRSVHDDASLAALLKPAEGRPSMLRTIRHASAASISYFRKALKGADTSIDPDAVFGAGSDEDHDAYARSIENYAGTVRMPLGIVGPLRVRGLHASGDYMVPLATTEAALVASYARGAEVVGRSGGATTVMVSEILWRSPAFVFADVLEAGRFLEWVCTNSEALKSVAETTTSHGRLVTIDPFMETNVVFLMCGYTTGDASGQNMVTIATEALCRAAIAGYPDQPRRWYVEGNFSGDKKGSHLGLIAGRGRKVTANVVVPDEVVRRCLRTTPEAIMDYSEVARLGSLMSGQFGAQAHYANALAALYIATGQDAACVAESAVGYTRVERREGALFFSVTLPNILVGTVGGGTGLPTQSAALSLMGLKGPGKAAALAEVTAALCLAGEISIMAAMSAGEFASAHRKLAREKPAAATKPKPEDDR